MVCAVALALALASPLVSAQIGYAPVLGPCPAGPLLRPATSVNPSERAFISQRYTKASSSLAAWLKKVDPAFPIFAPKQYPMIALSDGGGGLRGFTISAGIHKAFDSDEPDAANYSTAGLYQAVTYEAALSGTALMLYSYVQNNWPLTSSLLTNLWVPSMAAGFTKPQPTDADALIAAEVTTKQAAGYLVGLTDVWARILSYGSFYGSDPGVASTVSNFTNMPGFTSFVRPYPITTAIGINSPAADGCGVPPLTAPQYEFTPHEFGSWQAGVGNFIQSKYLGTSMNNGTPTVLGGMPVNLGLCVTGFDNAGWVAATSSSTFNSDCGGVAGLADSFFSAAELAILRATYTGLLGTGQAVNYAVVPNPFQGVPSATNVSGASMLNLVDGGETFQVPPIWPFLYRPQIDTVIVSDNSADGPTNYNQTYFVNLPSGVQIYHTYQQAVINGIGHRMPVIPTPDVFMAQNYNRKPMTFFGCSQGGNSRAVFIVYLPNRPVVYNSDIGAGVTQYNQSTTLGMIANGEAIATNNGDPMFAKCMACGLMRKSSLRARKTLPSYCKGCFKTYCATGS